MECGSISPFERVVDVGFCLSGKLAVRDSTNMLLFLCVLLSLLDSIHSSVLLHVALVCRGYCACVCVCDAEMPDIKPPPEMVSICGWRSPKDKDKYLLIDLRKQLPEFDEEEANRGAVSNVAVAAPGAGNQEE